MLTANCDQSHSFNYCDIAHTSNLCQRLEAIPLFCGQFYKNQILYATAYSMLPEDIWHIDIKSWAVSNMNLLLCPQDGHSHVCSESEFQMLHQYLVNSTKMPIFLHGSKHSESNYLFDAYSIRKSYLPKKHELVCSCEYSSSGLVSLDSPMLLMFRRWNLSVNGPRNIIKVPIIASLRLCARKHLAQPSVDNQQMA